MLNNWTGAGRLTRDVELRQTQSGKSVANFSIAIDRDFARQDGERDTDFIDVVVWDKTAEFVSKYFKKGSMIIVNGRLQVRTWQDDDGNNRRVYEIVANNVYFGGSKTTVTLQATQMHQKLKPLISLHIPQAKMTTKTIRTYRFDAKATTIRR